ncbi:MAG: DNA-binding response regulator [Elusimicrobia bacterium RIFOXYA2_FULL_39_19]|nr:MAG: DNA-binding response regulator [Elusimicrobia bacterium RIFOXYA2_FULL_39_19]
MKQKILVIDDEAEMRKLFKEVLEKEKFIVVSADNTEEGYKKVKESEPDLVLLDLKLPSIGGLRLCEMIKKDKATQHIPVIMVTCQDTDVDKVIGLEAGADDYITKPFNPKELAARVKAVLRRCSVEKEEQIVKSGEITVDLERHIVSVKNKAIELTLKEFELLHALIKKQGKIVTREFLMESIWEYEYFGSLRTIDSHVWSLRKKLGPAGKRIKTIEGVGYKFTD